jgi:hypothetical protein
MLLCVIVNLPASLCFNVLHYKGSKINARPFEEDMTDGEDSSVLFS